MPRDNSRIAPLLALLLLLGSLLLGPAGTATAAPWAAAVLPDLDPAASYYEAVTQLAARGILKGYPDRTFGTGDPVLRAQAVGTLVRALGWGARTPRADFADRGTIDAELWAAVRVLADAGVARGYGDATFGPTRSVSRQEAISFITRAMIARGIWEVRPGPAPFGDVAPAHSQDVATYWSYVAAIPGAASGAMAAAAPATRGWYAEVLWPAVRRLDPPASPGASPNPSSITVSTAPSPTTTPAAGNLVADGPVALAGPSVTPGSSLDGTVRYRNTGGNAVTVAFLALALRGPNGESADFAPTRGATTVSAGATLDLTGSVTVPPGAAPGTWSALSTWQDGAGAWHEGTATPLVVVAAAPIPTPAPGPVPAGLRLTFADEFDGTTLDTGKWRTALPWGSRTNPGNGELQYYGDDNVTVSGGSLHLQARRQAVGGMAYTSGAVNTAAAFSQRYGRFEARVKLPAGRGFWPAFWLLHTPDGKAWPWPPEVDIFENLGQDPSQLYTTVHYRDGGALAQQGGGTRAVNFATGFHVVALDWSPGLLVWSVDGREVFRATVGVPDVPMYVILNLAVGGNWPGSPDATTPFPAEMLVDYVRIYQYP